MANILHYILPKIDALIKSSFDFTKGLTSVATSTKSIVSEVANLGQNAAKVTPVSEVANLGENAAKVTPITAKDLLKCHAATTVAKNFDASVKIFKDTISSKTTWLLCLGAFVTEATVLTYQRFVSGTVKED